MTLLGRAYTATVIFVFSSTVLAWNLTPPNQSSADAFLPLFLIWSWLSSIGLAGIVAVGLRSRARRAVGVLLAAMVCAAASLIFDYWIVAILLRRDIAYLNEPMELVSVALYLLVAASSLIAPVALVIALFGLRVKHDA